MLSSKWQSLAGSFLRGNSSRATSFRSFSASQVHLKRLDCKVLVVGGGSGGCAMAAKLSSKLGKDKVIVVEPAERHYYQPMFTLVGGGMKRLDQCYRPMADVLPRNVQWLQECAVAFDPKNNTVTTSTGHNIKYDVLLIAVGLELNYEKIPGLVEALSIPKGKVCSVYSPQYVDRTLHCLRQIREGNAVFTYPNSPVKCPGAPQKIAYISDHCFRRCNKRQHINVIYNTCLPVIFGVKHYADALWKVVEKRGIEVNLCSTLIEVKPESDVAIFENRNNTDNICQIKYSMLHVTPPMSTPKELAECRELVNESGFVDVDKHTMQSLRYKNVFAIGDCANSPNSKTAAAAAAQSPVIYKNILATLKGKPLPNCYDGYSSCPLVTGYNTCILAEFDYSLTPLETFPVAQDKERYSMFIMKKDLMPPLYWHLMLNGHWDGPEPMRKLFSVFKFGRK